MHSCRANGNGYVRSTIDQQPQLHVWNLREVFQDRASQLRQPSCIQRLVAKLHEVDALPQPIGALSPVEYPRSVMA